MSKSDEDQPAPNVREEDRAPSGAPKVGWAVGDRFGWEEIHQRVLASADEEIASEPRELFFSGVTAGFAIVLTLIGYAIGSAQFPENPFLGSLLYPIGFMYIILGRYQLYTENTLPPVKLVLTRLASLPLLLRVWGIVLIANVIGAFFGTLIVTSSNLLPPEAMRAATHFVEKGLELPWWTVFSRALFAGWLVAGVVWIGTAARDTISRVLIIYLVFYVISVCNLFHVITTASEIIFTVFERSSTASIGTLVIDFWVPVLLGNTVGGVLAFSVMTYIQTEQRRYPEIRVLDWYDVLFSTKGGRPFNTPRPNPTWKKPEQKRPKEGEN